MRLGALGLLAAVCLSGAARAQDAGTPCVQSGPPPPYTGKYTSVADLCANAPRGTPAKGLVPPTGQEQQEAYAKKLRQWLVFDQAYKGLGWLSDAHWRLTGDYQGCPPDGNSYGVHPSVRIYYSPEVVEWICKGRTGDIPEGAMVVKEMASITQIIVDPKTQLMSVPQTTQADSWTVMVKNKAGSADGWYWGFFSGTDGNPPIVNRSGATDAGFPPNPPKPAAYWLPTGNTTVVYSNYMFGNYCFNCHASAEKESTYSSMDNVIGKELLYKWLGPLPIAAPRKVGLEGGLLFMRKRALRAQQRGPFTPARPYASPEFLETFRQLPPVPFSTAWKGRFPAQTYDHVVADPPPKGPNEFVTSDQCQPCHDATQSNASTPNMVLTRKDGTQVNLSPFGEWSASPMGLAGRDPIFLAQLESEDNLATRQGLGGKLACIESLCLHCHGVMGQRALAQDTGGTGPAAGLCQEFLPPDSRQGSGGKSMRRSTLAAWRDEDPKNARYGALARDGISCTACHHISAEKLGDPSTFTGNFYAGPQAQLNGPYDDPLPKPMEHALGITPKGAPQMKSSDLCSTCHAINLPVLDGKGHIIGFSYEQATSLEWENSDFAGPKGKSCQDCHMKTEYGGTPLSFKIANIEDSTFPPTTDRLPDADIALKPRTPYARHTLYGLNVFLEGFFEQFPVELGYRQLDFMNGEPVPTLTTGRQSALEQAKHDTALVTLDALARTPAGLRAKVTIANLTGHNFPSGVGFRRAFLEVQVLGAEGEVLWASGRTSATGVILDGVTDQPLPSEFFDLQPGGKQAFQDHHQVIRSGSEVQIYEELVQDSDRKFTTSFLHRVHLDVKDNRLRPKGWRRDGPFAEVTKPEGKATNADPDYSGPVLTGSDSIDYEISLAPEVLSQAKTVTVALLYQATPPYFLAQRFENAARGPLKDDTNRLYYLASHFNTDARAADGSRYLEGWKLQIARLSRPVPAPP
ncbi:MAG TPA: hypothetical protein VIG99_22280 [Myxococcaceae bacterium]